jgi:hypothetical protein
VALALPDIEDEPRVPDRVQLVLLAILPFALFMAPFAEACPEAVVPFMQLALAWFDMPAPPLIEPEFASV